MCDPIRLKARMLLLGALLLAVPPAHAQSPETERSSRNVQLLAHVPMGPVQSATPEKGRARSVVLDQGDGRSYAYVASHSGSSSALQVFDISDPAHPERVSVLDAAPGAGEATDITTFRIGGSTFVAMAFRDGTGRDQVGAEIVDVSTAGSPASVARVSAEGGFVNLFAYRHSHGAGYLFAAGGGDIHVYELADLAAGRASLVAGVAVPDEVPNVDYGFHDMYAGYEISTETDRLYAAGAGGYYVFDITQMDQPQLLTAVNDAAVQIGHAVTATPDGTHLVTAAGYRTAPLRIYDLRPALDGTIPRIRAAIGAWTANWRNYSERHQLRWPYVFVASQVDGLQVFNMRYPIEPFTVAWFRTWDGPAPRSVSEDPTTVGAIDVDVRNRDGLVAVLDARNGLWLVRLEEFTHWDGRGYGLPNLSSVQDWDKGPLVSTEWELP